MAEPTAWGDRSAFPPRPGTADTAASTHWPELWMIRVVTVTRPDSVETLGAWSQPKPSAVKGPRMASTTLDRSAYELRKCGFLAPLMAGPIQAWALDSAADSSLMVSEVFMPPPPPTPARRPPQ